MFSKAPVQHFLQSYPFNAWLTLWNIRSTGTRNLLFACVNTSSLAYTSKVSCKSVPVSFKAWKVSRRGITSHFATTSKCMHNRILSRSIILNTSEHRSTIKTLLVGTLQQELQVTSRQILGGLSKSLATLMLSLPFVPGSPACIKRWRFLARFLSSFAASSLSDVGGELPSLGAVRPGQLMSHARCQKWWYHVQVHIETTCFCWQIRADPLCDFIPNSFEPRQRFASVRNSPNLLFAAAPLSSPENTMKIAHFDPILPGSIRPEGTGLGWVVVTPDPRSGRF